jgi:hypothetical protein
MALEQAARVQGCDATFLARKTLRGSSTWIGRCGLATANSER